MSGCDRYERATLSEVTNLLADVIKHHQLIGIDFRVLRKDLAAGVVDIAFDREPWPGEPGRHGDFRVTVRPASDNALAQDERLRP